MVRSWIVFALILADRPSRARAATEFSDEILISNTADNAQSVFAADLDGDGDLDVLSASWEGDSCTWYENLDGKGTFTNGTRITTTADAAGTVTAADLDGDGDMDVVLGVFIDNSVLWFENEDGQGTFSDAKVITENATEAYSVAVADLDGDGDMDVLSGSHGDNIVQWFENDGFGRFTNGSVITSDAVNVWSVYAADIDGDGDMDVLSAHRGDGFVNGGVTWYRNNLNEGGTFYDMTTPSSIISQDTPLAYSVYAADLDGDGDMDVLCVNDDTVQWFSNTEYNSPGGRTFSVAKVISRGLAGARRVFAADLDNDGDMDVLTASWDDGTVRWFENLDGFGTFSEEMVLTSDFPGSNYVFAADLNSDGYLDVLSSADVADEVIWFENKGGSTGKSSLGELFIILSAVASAALLVVCVVIYYRVRRCQNKAAATPGKIPQESQSRNLPDVEDSVPTYFVPAPPPYAGGGGVDDFDRPSATTSIQSAGGGVGLVAVGAGESIDLISVDSLATVESTRAVSVALEMIRHSPIAVLQEIVALIRTLTCLLRECQNDRNGAEKAMRWCRSMVCVLGNVSRGRQESLESSPIVDLLDDAHAAMEDLIQVVNFFLVKGSIGSTLTSSLFRRKQAGAEVALRDALTRLKTGDKLDSLAAMQGGQEFGDNPRRERVKQRRELMLAQQEVAESQVSFFPDLQDLGNGRFGNVQLVNYRGVMVAAKVTNLAPALLPMKSSQGRAAATNRLRRAFTKDLHTMVLLSSQRVTSVFGAITTSPTRLVLLTEFIEGADLRTLLDKDRRNPLVLGLAHSLALDVALGMECLHSKEMLHGNLKSPNVLLAMDYRAKICDFGMLQTTRELTGLLGSSTHQAYLSSYKLTPQWSAPEVLQGEGTYLESDVYSYGVLLWEIATRKMPWGDLPDTIEPITAEVCQGGRPPLPQTSSQVLVQTMVQCWQGNPLDRLTFRDIVASLQSAQGDEDWAGTAMAEGAAAARFSRTDEMKIDTGEEFFWGQVVREGASSSKGLGSLMQPSVDSREGSAVTGERGGDMPRQPPPAYHVAVRDMALDGI